MAETKQPEVVPGVADLRRFVEAICKKEGQSERKILEGLLTDLGYKIPKLTIRPQLTVKFNSNFKNFLRQKETEIKNRVKRKDPYSLCGSAAQYIIRTALCNHCCFENNKRIKKYEVDRFLGYCERTMLLQQKSLRNTVLDPYSESKERKIYQEFCSDLKEFAT